MVQCNPGIMFSIFTNIENDIGLIKIKLNNYRYSKFENLIWLIIDTNLKFFSNIALVTGRVLKILF